MSRADRAVGLLCVAVALFGCGDANQYVEPPPPVVTVAPPLRREVTDYLEFTGTTAASGRVLVRARVSGILEEMHFTPGTTVEAGDPLFTIDPREYEADLKSAQAELASARASHERARIELTRAQNLFARQAGSEVEVVKWRGEIQQAEAAIKTAEARIARAELNLGYTEVRAPISGRVGREQLQVGNLVGEGEATILTDITAYDPMHVYMNLNERDLLRVLDLERTRSDAGLADDAGNRRTIGLEMALANEDDFPHRGVVDFSESALDPATGTLQLRGVFPNPGPMPKLLPGLFTRVRLPIATRPDMPLVSERALGADQSGQFVLLVNSDSVVEKRNVVEGQLIDGLRVIEDGLRGDEWVVVVGVQRARPGAKVDPRKARMEDFSASALRAPRAAKVTPAAAVEPEV